MTKEARAGLVDVIPNAPTHRLFVTDHAELYEQDRSGRVLMNGRAVSPAPLADFGTPRLMREREVHRYERIALLFVRALPHGVEAMVMLTNPVRVLGIEPATTLPTGAAAWLHLARELILEREHPPGAA